VHLDGPILISQYFMLFKYLGFKGLRVFAYLIELVHSSHQVLALPGRHLFLFLLSRVTKEMSSVYTYRLETFIV
jgi:hypothetical protein